MVKNIIYIIVAIVFIFGYFRYIEYKSSYFPMKELEFFPNEVGLSYEDVYVDTDDGKKLNAWLVPAEGARYTLLFFHGNGGNISHRVEKILMLNKLGLSILIFDYRGYGRSTGRPTEGGLYKDAQAVYRYLVSRKGVSPEGLIFYGESLGGAVAIELANKRKVKALITECTFSSVRDVARTVYPYLPSFFISPSFNSLDKIKNINIPKLIIHSKNDEIIPFKQSIKLFEAAPEPKTHLVLTGSHNNCFQDSRDSYLQGIEEFLAGL